MTWIGVIYCGKCAKLFTVENVIIMHLPVVLNYYKYTL